MVDYFDTGDDFVRLDHMRFRVEQSFWSTPLQESNGEATGDYVDRTKLYWHVKILDVLQADFDLEIPPTKTISFGVGDGWYPDEAGREIRHKDAPPDDMVEAGRSKPKLPHPASGVGRIVDLITGKRDTYTGRYDVVDGGGPVVYDMIGAAKFLRDQGPVDIRNAAMWAGSEWVSRGLAFHYRGMDEAVPGTWPTAFVGGQGAPSGASAASAPVMEQKVEATAERVAEMLPPTTEPELVDKVTAILNGSTSPTEFMRNAVGEIPSELMPFISDTTYGPWSLRG